MYVHRLVYFGGKKVNFTGAGALGIIVLGVVSKIEWCKIDVNNGGNDMKAIESFAKMNLTGGKCFPLEIPSKAGEPPNEKASNQLRAKGSYFQTQNNKAK